ncbi:phosphatase PAP2 family protein [Angustibacter sp. McL0619]|uniref:phosphatase PAP2 family protein n=1 Tax=Angustibacter sp. McL0619 TaxID=3415676 RepID=UPI003CEAA196
MSPTTAQQARPRLVAGAVAAVVCAVPVAVLALLIRDQSGAVVRFDQRVVQSTTGWAIRHEVLADIAEVGGYVLHPFVFRFAVLVAAILLWRNGARTAALWVASTMLVGTLLGVALKAAVSRARPVLDQPVSFASGFSFPSGHALNAALGCSLLVVLLWRPAGRRRHRVVLVAVAVVLTLLTGLDRLVLGVHFPSDVVAGWLVGGLVVAASWVAFGPVLRQRALRGAERAVDEQADEPADEPTRRRNP